MKVFVKNFDGAYGILNELMPEGSYFEIKLLRLPMHVHTYELSFKPSEESDEMKETWKNRFIDILLDLNGYQSQHYVVSVVTESAWEQEMLIDALAERSKGMDGTRFNAKSQLCGACINEVLIDAVFDEYVVDTVRSKT